MYPDFAHSLIEVGEESGDLQPVSRSWRIALGPILSCGLLN